MEKCVKVAIILGIIFISVESWIACYQTLQRYRIKSMCRTRRKYSVLINEYNNIINKHRGKAL